MHAHARTHSHSHTRTPTFALARTHAHTRSNAHSRPNAHTRSNAHTAFTRAALVLCRDSRLDPSHAFLAALVFCRDSGTEILVRDYDAPQIESFTEVPRLPARVCASVCLCPLVRGSGRACLCLRACEGLSVRLPQSYWFE